MVATGPGAVATRPSWRRWLLAALPWIAAAALGTLGLASRGGTAPPAPPVASSPDATGAEARSDDGMDSLPPLLELAVLDAARTTLGTAGLPVPGPAPGRWPLDLRVSGTLAIDDGLTVVTVHALVIEEGDGGWSAPRVSAVAVPVRTAPPAAVLGAAWPVRSTVLPPRPPSGSDADDPGAEVATALTEAGWSVREVTRVERVLGRHLRVTVSGTAPDDDTVATHTVWLHDDAGGPRPLVTTALPQESP